MFGTDVPHLGNSLNKRAQTRVWSRSRALNGQPQSSPHTLNLSICSPRTPIMEHANREASRCCNLDNAAEVEDSLLFKGITNLMLIAWIFERLHLVLRHNQVHTFSLVNKPFLRKTKFTEAVKAEGVEGASHFTALRFCNCFSSN